MSFVEKRPYKAAPAEAMKEDVVASDSKTMTTPTLTRARTHIRTMSVPFETLGHDHGPFQDSRVTFVL
eukprot:2805635-Rhodomonas_salina.1